MAEKIIKIECFFVTKIVSRLRNVVYPNSTKRCFGISMCSKNSASWFSQNEILTRGSVKNWCYSTENPEIEWETIPWCKKYKQYILNIKAFIYCICSMLYIHSIQYTVYCTVHMYSGLDSTWFSNFIISCTSFEKIMQLIVDDTGVKWCNGLQLCTAVY